MGLIDRGGDGLTAIVVLARTIVAPAAFGLALVADQPRRGDDDAAAVQSARDEAGDHGFAETDDIREDHAVVFLQDGQRLIDGVQLVTVFPVPVFFQSSVSWVDRMTPTVH